MQQGENWNYLMSDCMIKEQCIEILVNYNLTLPGSNVTTLIWAGTYLDTVADADTLAQLPSDIKVWTCSGCGLS